MAKKVAKRSPGFVRYADYLEVDCSASELVLSFGQCRPAGEATIHTTIVTHPVHARDFVNILQEAILRPPHR